MRARFRAQAMRLDKFISNNSPYSRSEARRLLRSGRLLVNGKPTGDAGQILAASDEVTLDGKVLTARQPRYLMVHKPAGVVSATEDGGHRTVLDLLPATLRPDLHIAGRLDIDSTGLVLLTDDGQWSHRAKAPGQHEKRYRVATARPLEAGYAEAFATGLRLRGEEDQPTRPARLEVLAPCEALVWLQEGRYHQVKRMFAALGNHVESLHREAVGRIELDATLAPGQWRSLTAAEIASVGEKFTTTASC